MNNNLKNHSIQPDPSVWENISDTLRRTKLRRQIVGGACGAAIVAAAIVAVVLWPRPVQDASVTTTLPVVAQQMTQPVQPVQAAAEPVQAAADAVEQTPRPAAEAGQVQAVGCQPDVVVAKEGEPRPMAREAFSAPAADTKPVVAAVAAAPVAKPVTAAPANRQEDHSVAEPAPVGSEVVVQTPADKSPKVAKQEDTIMWFPNIFAPASGEPEISTFRAHLSTGAGSVSNFKMSIFNRAGQMVFRTTDINQTWDGTYKGSLLPQGAYVYVAVYTDQDGLQHQRKGVVTLVR